MIPIEFMIISYENALGWMQQHSYYVKVNIGLVNGLVFSINKPLPKPIMVQIDVTMWCFSTYKECITQRY